jgi:hypothetical protein
MFPVRPAGLKNAGGQMRRKNSHKGGKLHLQERALDRSRAFIDVRQLF